MAYPVSSVQSLSVLSGKSNGRLPSDILVAIPGQSGGATITLVAPAARAFKALIGEAKKAGHILKTNGPAYSYRTYDQQVATFKSRYVPYYTRHTDGSVRYRYWNGVRWYHRTGPVVAVPGTSNHGWGRAVDMGEENDGDIYADNFDYGTLNWLIANERRFGISHEIQSEPWHIRYFAGDQPPAAVLAWEASQGSDPEPEPEPEDDDVRYIMKGSDSNEWWITDGITKRYLNDRGEAAQLAYSGLARWDPEFDDGAAGKGGPFIFPQSLVDDITTVPRAKTLT